MSLVEELDIDYSGVVAFGIGHSQALFKYMNMDNIYSLSLTLSSECDPSSHPLSRREFGNVLSTLIGNSRQSFTDSLDLLHSIPIHIQDILIKDFKHTQTIQETKQINSIETRLQVRCERGCNVNRFLVRLLSVLSSHFSVPFTLTSSEVTRTKHCGIADSSPLCVDLEDITNLPFRHRAVAPWFVLNDITMLRDHCVAYVASPKLFQRLRTEKAIAAANGVEFYERWEVGGKEEAVAMKPLAQVPMLLLCGPKKTLTPVNRRGKRKMQTTPVTFWGVGHVEDVGGESVLKADTVVSPSDATIVHTDSTKAKNYFHKARKVTPYCCVC